jgi:hypothetical protein
VGIERHGRYAERGRDAGHGEGFRRLRLQQVSRCGENARA